MVAGELELAVGAIWASPWLVTLPWIRNRIHVEETLFVQSIRFGRGAEPERPAGQPLDYGDVIDVEGQELSE